MRTEDAPLAGREHLIYRSYYVPVKGVIDGDLCERFSVIGSGPGGSAKREKVAAELDRRVREVERKIAVGDFFPPHLFLLAFPLWVGY